ncbi:MAG: hypothetical protein JM58_15665 [Peptococcaceae bacterium BICA1-8]|nr:MAG: hypothetical protein JM58_15665 [Peptococcaceae bacterium BICA1-8]
MPTREIYWNISGHFLMYILFLIALGVFAYGIYKRVKLWNQGEKENRSFNITYALRQIFLHQGLLKKSLPGFMHLTIFFGFLVLTIATILVAIQADFGLIILKGNFYLIFSLLTDLAGFLILIGIIIALSRRIFFTDTGLDNKWDDYIVLGIIGAIVITGFIIEGLRLDITQVAWAGWSPIGVLFSIPFRNVSITNQQSLHQILWWIHLLLAMFFIAYIPYSKLFHIIVSFLNQAYYQKDAGRVLTRLDLENEEAETFGVGASAQFTWKQRMDLDACTRCGRCQTNCPAYNSQKPLNPKELTQNLKSIMYKEELSNLPSSAQFAEVAATVKAKGLNNEISEDVIWSCTTCLACQEGCPVNVEHIQKIVDIRRYNVLTEGDFPGELQSTFRNIETNGNPWGISWSSRENWAKETNIPIGKSLEENTILYWPGCFGAYDERIKKVSQAFAQILQKANISFTILGNSEKCCGDSVRRLGNEYLYQMLVMENIETLQERGITKIVTQCPHCYNSLKNEYPKFGGNFEVSHHTEFINLLIKGGSFKQNIEKLATITYHDPCYLGRYNELYEAPRDILRTVKGLKLIEMPRNKENSFCCGAGGGRMWLEENIGNRISSLRAQEAANLNAELLCTACPFCLTMFSDEGEKGLPVKDIAEIILGDK